MSAGENNAEQNIQAERDRIDALDGSLDGKVGESDADTRTRIYLQRVRLVQSRLREARQALDVRKDMRDPEWGKTEERCQQVEQCMLDALRKINHATLDAGQDEFNKQLDTFLAGLADTDASTNLSERHTAVAVKDLLKNWGISGDLEQKALIVEQRIGASALRKADENLLMLERLPASVRTALLGGPTAVPTRQQLMDQVLSGQADSKSLLFSGKLREAASLLREHYYGDLSRFQGDLQRLSKATNQLYATLNGLTKGFADSQMIALNGDESVIRRTLADIRKNEKSVQQVQERMIPLGQTVTALDLVLRTTRAHGLRIEGRSEEADRTLLRIREEYGQALEKTQPELWKESTAAGERLHSAGKLSAAETRLFRGDVRGAQSDALVELRNAEINADILDQLHVRSRNDLGTAVIGSRLFVNAKNQSDSSVEIRDGHGKNLKEVGYDNFVFCPIDLHDGRSLYVVLSREASVTLSRIREAGADPVFLSNPRIVTVEASDQGRKRTFWVNAATYGPTEIVNSGQLAGMYPDGMIRDAAGNPKAIPADRAQDVQRQLDLRTAFKVTNIQRGAIGNRVDILTASGKQYPNVSVSHEVLKKLLAPPPPGMTLVLTPGLHQERMKTWDIHMLQQDNLAYAATDGSTLQILREAPAGKEQRLETASVTDVEKGKDEAGREFLRTIEADPAIVATAQAASKVGTSFGHLQGILSNTGVKTEALVEEARSSAGALKDALGNADLQANVREAKATLAKLREAGPGIAGGEIEREIDARISAMDTFLKLLEDQKIKQQLETILDKSKFHQDTWDEWLKHDGAKLLITIAVAIVAAAACVMSCGAAAAPMTLLLAGAAGGAAGGIVGSELAAESLHFLHEHYDDDLKKGLTYTDRSRVGDMLFGEQFRLDPQTQQLIRKTWTNDVIAPYFEEFLQSFATTFATMGIGNAAGKFLGKALSRSAFVQELAETGGVQRMGGALSRILRMYESVQDKTAFAKFAAEMLQELRDEALEGGVTGALNTYDERLGILGGLMLSTANGTKITTVQGFQQAIIGGLSARGYTVVAGENGAVTFTLADGTRGIATPDFGAAPVEGGYRVDMGGVDAVITFDAANASRPGQDALHAEKAGGGSGGEEDDEESQDGTERLGTAAGETPSEAATREALTENLAANIQEDWRSSRRLPGDGVRFESRMKGTSDNDWVARKLGITPERAATLPADQRPQVDIANSSFAELPKDWQAENRQSATAVLTILAGVPLEAVTPEWIDGVGGPAVHDAWMLRYAQREGFTSVEQLLKTPGHPTDWEKTVLVPYEQLSEAEKEKDRKIIRLCKDLLANYGGAKKEVQSLAQAATSMTSEPGQAQVLKSLVQLAATRPKNTLGLTQRTMADGQVIIRQGQKADPENGPKLLVAAGGTGVLEIEREWTGADGQQHKEVIATRTLPCLLGEIALYTGQASATVTVRGGDVQLMEIDGTQFLRYTQSEIDGKPNPDYDPQLQVSVESLMRSRLGFVPAVSGSRTAAVVIGDAMIMNEALPDAAVDAKKELAADSGYEKRVEVPAVRKEASPEQLAAKREVTQVCRDFLTERSDQVKREIDERKKTSINKLPDGKETHYVYQTRLQIGAGPHGIAYATAAERQHGAAARRLILMDGVNLSKVFSGKEGTNLFYADTLPKANPDVDPLKGILDLTSTAVGGSDNPSTGNVGELLLRAAAQLDSPIMDQTSVERVEVRTPESTWDVDALFRVTVTVKKSVPGPDGKPVLTEETMYLYTDVIDDATGLGNSRIPVPVSEVQLNGNPVRITETIAAIEATGVQFTLEQRAAAERWLKWQSRGFKSLTTAELAVYLGLPMDGQRVFAATFQTPPPVEDGESTYRSRSMMAEEMKQAAKTMITGEALPGITPATIFIPGMTDRTENRLRDPKAPEVLGKRDAKIAVLGSGYTGLVVNGLLVDAMAKAGEPVDSANRRVTWIGDTPDDSSKVIADSNRVNMQPGYLVTNVEKIQATDEDGKPVTRYRVHSAETLRDDKGKTVYVNREPQLKPGGNTRSEDFDHVVVTAGFENQVDVKFGDQSNSLIFKTDEATSSRLEGQNVAVSRSLVSAAGQPIPSGAYTVVGAAANWVAPENRAEGESKETPLSQSKDLARMREHLPERMANFLLQISRNVKPSKVKQRLDDACKTNPELQALTKYMTKVVTDPGLLSDPAFATESMKLAAAVHAQRDTDKELNQLLEDIETPYNNSSPDSLDQLMERSALAGERKPSIEARAAAEAHVSDQVRRDFLSTDLGGAAQRILKPAVRSSFNLDLPSELNRLQNLGSPDAPHWREVAGGARIHLLNLLGRLGMEPGQSPPTVPVKLEFRRVEGGIAVTAEGIDGDALKTVLQDETFRKYADGVLENHGQILDISFRFHTDGSVDRSSLEIRSPLEHITRSFGRRVMEAGGAVNIRASDLEQFVQNLNQVRMPGQYLPKPGDPPESFKTSDTVKNSILRYCAGREIGIGQELTVEDGHVKEGSGACYYLIRNRGGEVVAVFTVYPKSQHRIPLNYTYQESVLRAGGLEGRTTPPQDMVLIKHKDGDEHIGILTMPAPGKELGVQIPFTPTTVMAAADTLARANAINFTETPASALHAAAIGKLVEQGLLSYEQAYLCTHFRSVTHGGAVPNNFFIDGSGDRMIATITGYAGGGSGEVGTDLMTFVEALRVRNTGAAIIKSFIDAYFHRLEASIPASVLAGAPPELGV